MSRDAASQNLHATAIAVGERGLLILGGSGAGKSALALRMIALGARLVADDRVVLVRRDAALVAAAVPGFGGVIEARGVGILRVPAVAEAVVELAVDLDERPTARMPQRKTITHLRIETELISGGDLPHLDVMLTLLLQNGRATGA